MRTERAAASRFGLGVIVALYMAHALPLYFYNVAVPAILRSQGVDLRWIGMLSLLYLPWAFKFLWAPLVDRWHLPALGRRRSWLWLTQLLLLVGILVLAFTGLDHGLTVFVLVGMWISTIAATQDIAIDGYTVEALAPAEHRLGSMAQSVGVALGSMVGGAGVLWLYETRGWTVALLSLAAMSALTLLAVQQINEGARPATAQRPSVLRALRRPELRWALLLIVLYRLVEAPAMAMINPLLVDQKWSLTEIGLLISVGGAGVGMLAAIGAAWLLKQRSAEQLLLHSGWWRTALYLLLAALLYSGALASSQLGLGVLVVALLALRYVAMTSLYALFMRLSSREQAGTDFTLLVCFELLVFFIAGALSGFLAKGLGYPAYYVALAIVSALGLLLCRPLLRRFAPSPFFSLIRSEDTMRHTAATLPLALLSLAISGQLAAQASTTTGTRQLDAVSVTAVRGARSVAEIAGTVYAIEREQIAQQTAAGRSTADILGQLVPSLAPASGTTSNYGMTMRGRSVQVMIDGVPLTGARDGSRQLNSISPTMIERIEVISGATALYGAGASGGIINIITLQPGDAPVRLASQLGLRTPSDVSSDNLAWNAAQTMTVRGDSFSGAFGIAYGRQGASLDAHGRRIGPEIAQTDRQDTETKELNARLEWALTPAQQLSLGVRWYDDQQDSDYGPDYGPRLAVLFNPAYQPSHNAVDGLQLNAQPRTRHQGVNAQYRNRDLLGGQELSVEAYYRNEQGRWFPSVSTLVHPALPGGYAYVAMQSNTDIDVWGLRSALHKGFDIGGRSLQLSYGVDHEREEDSQRGQMYDINRFIASNGLNYVPTAQYAMGPDVRVDTTGLFLQADHALSERFSVQAGVRHQILRNNVDDSLPYTEAITADAVAGYQPQLLAGGRVRHSQTLFNAGVVYKFREAQQLFANFSQGFSLPDTQRMLRDVPANFVIDSRNIGPIKVDNYELGWRLNNTQLQSAVTAFYNRSDKTVQFNRNYSVSVADTDERVYGVEANLRYTPTAQLELGASVASTRGQYRDAAGQWRELNAFRVSPLKAGVHGQWRFANDSLLRLQGQAIGGTDDAWRDAQVAAVSPTIRATPAAKIRGYAVFDLIGELPLAGGRFSVGVYNLADRNYKTVYGQQAEATYGKLSSVPAQGRTFGVGYRVVY